MKNENTFVKLYGQILLEMPYLFNLNQAKVPNSAEHFDLELERFPDEQSLKAHLSELFRAGTLTDKYGNSITIRNWEDSQNLFKRMFKDRNVLAHIRHIVKVDTLNAAQRWLVFLKKTIDRVAFMHESMGTTQRKKYKIYAMYKQNGESLLRGHVKAYSQLQAVSYFLRLHPEFKNDRLYHVYAEEDVPVMRTPYRDD
jgi:hypothetical protein